MNLCDHLCECGLRTWLVATVENGRAQTGYICPACGPIPAKMSPSIPDDILIGPKNTDNKPKP